MFDPGAGPETQMTIRSHAATTTAAAAVDGDATSVTDPAAPFGLPVLDELPDLAGALHALQAADRALAAAIDGLVRLHATGLVETATGIGLDGWLTIIARRTRTDRRMLLCVVEMCHRLPHLHACFAAGELTWAQLRSVVLQVHRLPRHLDQQLDTAIAGAIDQCADHDPDTLPRLVRWIIDDLLADQPADPADTAQREVLILQPRLDGTGGRLFGDLGPVGFAALDAATEPGPPDLDDHGRPDHRTVATRRAHRLTDLCLTGPAQGSHNIKALLRIELSTLLDLDQSSGQLLTHLTGGAMWTDAATARHLADHASSIRLIVTHNGAPIGVGRARRTPPGWLRDAILALHDTCTQPGCHTAARVCDTDHARPWTHGGTTDIDNLAPVCATGNHHKETDGWHVTQTPDGHRTWTHPRTGLTTRTAPATWRPPPPDSSGNDPPAQGRPPNPGNDPPDLLPF